MSFAVYIYIKIKNLAVKTFFNGRFCREIFTYLAVAILKIAALLMSTTHHIIVVFCMIYEWTDMTGWMGTSEAQ